MRQRHAAFYRREKPSNALDLAVSLPEFPLVLVIHIVGAVAAILTNGRQRPWPLSSLPGSASAGSANVTAQSRPLLDPTGLAVPKR